MSQWIDVKERLPEVDPENLNRTKPYRGHPFAPVLFYVKHVGLCAGRFFPRQTKLRPPHPDIFVSLQGVVFEKRRVTDWMPPPLPPSR